MRQGNGLFNDTGEALKGDQLPGEDLAVIGQKIDVGGRDLAALFINIGFLQVLIPGLPIEVGPVADLGEVIPQQVVMAVDEAGKQDVALEVEHAAERGGNARVGLEDNLYLEKGRLAKSNAEQVAKIIRIARELGIEPATPSEAREMLGLKGMDKLAC